jgi:hypothetical protein
MNTNGFLTWEEAQAQDGKILETPVMVINNTVFPEWQFREWCEQGWFPKRIIKAGWRPTHVEITKLHAGRSRFSPFEPVLRTSYEELREIVNSPTTK